MKHAGPSTLARLGPLLADLRARAALRETRPGVFSLRSRAFLHFHDDPSGIFADARIGEGFVRMPVSTASQQADLLERIDEFLADIEARTSDRRRGKRRGA